MQVQHYNLLSKMGFDSKAEKINFINSTAK